MSTEEYHFRMKHPRIFWWCELLPHEIEWKPYNYDTKKDINFVWSWRHNNAIRIVEIILFDAWIRLSPVWQALIVEMKAFWIDVFVCSRIGNQNSWCIYSSCDTMSTGRWWIYTV
jgi:hypothetical protein